MADAFTVGDFKAGSNKATRKSAAPAEKIATPPPAPIPEGDEEVMEKSAAPKTIAELYRERLVAADISDDEANAVFDDVVTQGYYQESVMIRGRRVIFRTRTYDDHVRTMAAVEAQGPRFQATQEEIQARHNLAASLVEWNGVVYKSGRDHEKEFVATMDAIRRFPAPLYSLLLNALVKFDARMFVIFSEGAAESF